MKTLPILAAIMLFGAASAVAQQAGVDATLTRKNPTATLGTAAVQKETYVGGVFTRTYKNKRELKLVNPLYPNPFDAPPGWTGAENLVFNPSTGQAEGVALLRIKF